MRMVKKGASEFNAAQLFVTQFKVASKYVIEVEEKIGYVRIPLREIGRGMSFRDYSPTEAGSIYTHLAKVKDEKSLLKFVHQFGLLGLDIRNNKRGFPSGVIPKKIMGFEDKIIDIYDAAYEVRKILHYWGKLQKGDIIGRILSLDGEKPELTIDFLRKTLDKDFVNMVNPEHIDKTTPTKIYLAFKISQNLSGVRPTANLSPAGDIIPGFAYLSLYDAIWHQLYLEITRQADFKECPHCQSWHTGRGKFCPPPPFYTRSPCENAFNQKEHRKKRRTN